MDLNYLWDTNVLLLFLKDVLTPKGDSFVDKVLQEMPPSMSIISEMELLGWPQLSFEEEIGLKSFIWESVVFPLSDEVKKKAIAIRKELQLKLPDAIILATAEVHDLILLTTDKELLQKANEHRVVNPLG